MSRPHPLRDSLLALSLLTVVPTGVEWPEGERTDVAGWFPAVGGLIGALTFGVFSLARLTGRPESMPLLSAVVLVAGVALFTRLLHYDGLADVADAWWGGASIQRRLEIMKDSATGAFGATALILAIVLQVAAASELISARQVVALCVVPVFGRLSATFAAWLGKPARSGGLGRSVMGGPSLPGVVPAILVCVGTFVVVALVHPTFSGAGYVCSGLVLALVVPHLVSGRMGGVTGDVMGASVLVVETLTYVAAALFFVG